MRQVPKDRQCVANRSGERQQQSMATILYTFAVCTALLCICSGQSIPQSAARLEEPQQTLEEARSPQHETWDTDRQQAPLDTSYVPGVEARQLVDTDRQQAPLDTIYVPGVEARQLVDTDRQQAPLDTIYVPGVEARQLVDTDRQQAPLDTSHVPGVEALHLVDKGETQLDQAKDDLKTDEFRFWGYRPYHGRHWGGGWNGYPTWGWHWNNYGSWRDYGYGRRYPYFYGYYW